MGGQRTARNSEVIREKVQVDLKGDVVSFDTQANEIYLITPA